MEVGVQGGMTWCVQPDDARLNEVRKRGRGEEGPRGRAAATGRGEHDGKRGGEDRAIRDEAGGCAERSMRAEETGLAREDRAAMRPRVH